MGLTIRTFDERDRDTLVSWVVELGWNPGLRDGDCLLETDPKGVFIAEIDGRMVGCATGIAYDDTFGFVGALVVDPALRGNAQHVLLRIYRCIKDYLGVRNVGIDAMPVTQHFFAAVGCVTAYRHIRFEGPIIGGVLSPGIVPLTEVPFEDVCACDAVCFPARRERFLRLWLEAYGAGGFACLRQGRLAGFGVLRKALRGFRVGPLLADDPGIAEDLLRAMGTRSGIESVALDIPEPNTSALALAERVGLARGYDTARMYLRVVPELPLERIFGIASYEFG